MNREKPATAPTKETPVKNLAKSGRSRSFERAGRVLVALAMSAATFGAVVVTAGPAEASSNPTVTMTASAGTVKSGDSLTYTVTVTGGTSKYTNVKLTDQLNGLTNVVLTSSRGFCFISNGLVTCEGGSLPRKETTWTVTIRGTVTAASGETLSNTVTATGRKAKSTEVYRATATTHVLVDNGYHGPLPELSLSIAAPDDAPVNAPVRYTLTVNNSGGANVNDLKVTATLPPGFAADSVLGTNLFDCAVSAPTITCAGGRLDAGANATITINATSASDFERYTLTAVVDPEDAVLEGNEGNNDASHEIFLPAAPPPTEPITFTKSGPAQIRVNDIITYTINVVNTSPKYNADKLSVVDGTQGLDLASVTATTTNPKLICTPSTSQVICAGRSSFRLEKLKSVVISISGRVVATPGSVLQNTATLSTLQNKVQITRRSTVTTTVRPPVDLTVTQFASCADEPAPANLDNPWGNCPFRARDQFNYIITVGNSGLDDAVNVRLREPLAPGVVFEGFTDKTGAGFTCSESDGVVTCLGGTVQGQLSSGQFGGTTEQVVLHLTAPNQKGPISGTVTVDPFNAIHEPDENNNTATTTTQILTGIDLTIMKSAKFDPVAPAGTQVYTVIVSNIGTADATGVKMIDILPAGTRFRSAQEVPNPPMFPEAAAHGFSCSHDGSATGGTVTCVGGRLQGRYGFNGGPPWAPPALTDTATIEITVFAPTMVGPTLNQALVDPDNQIEEIDENNNLTLLETEVEIPTDPNPTTDGTFIELTVESQQTKPAAGTAVAPNGTLEYTLTVRNRGSDPATNISVLDVIPQGSRFRAANSSPLTGGNGGFQCAFNAGVVLCGNGALAGWDGVGAVPSATIKILLFAPDTPTDETSNYTNHAVIDPNNTIDEADETNNVSDTLTVVNVGGENTYNQLVVTTEQAVPAMAGHVAPSGTLIYRVHVTNVGSDQASNILVRDFLPSGTTFRSARLVPAMSTGASGFACTHSEGVVECRSGTLQTAGHAVIDVTLFAPTQPATINNQAVVDPNNTIPEGNEGDNTAFSADTIVSLDGTSDFIELSIDAMTGTPDPVATDSILTYSLTVKNDGTDQAFNVRVSDHLPAGATFVSAVDSGPASGRFTCNEAGGTVDCVGGSLAGAGGTRAITIKVRTPGHGDVFNDTNSTTITNVATVDPANAIAEGDETNNGRTVTTTVLANVDLSVTNTGCGGSGTECDWMFTVTNNGPDAVTGVVVETSLPVGVIPLNVQVGTPANWSCQIEENPINKITCTGTRMTNGETANFTAHVYVTAEGETIHSTTVVDPDNTIVESNENNNTAQGQGST